ncbi:MAG: protein kinase, partial [Planctomycetes bacterium]|nr:protein kinase [Planctomycetota bacterium]
MLESIWRATTKLEHSDWTLIDRAVEELEIAWQSGRPIALAEWVPPPGDRLREPILVELIKVDQEFRWRNGEPKPLEEYLREWPELAHQPALVTELVQAECVNRAVAGEEPPSGGELRSRFPDLEISIDEAQIERLVRQESRPSCREELHATIADERPRSEPDTSRTGETVALPGPDQAGERRNLIGRRIGRYEIRHRLGTGGMGEVYLAFDTKLRRDVALKIPHALWGTDSHVLRRFVREAQSAAGVDHKNVCPIYDAGEVDGMLYIAMRLVPGPTLRELIQQEQLTPKQSAEIIMKLARALAAVHKKNLIHRDIKPSNILLDDGEPLLADFGLVRPHESDLSLSDSQALIGTVPYMAPELIDGQPADVRSDVYSLGVVLYQLLTGRLPFTGPLSAIMYKIVHDAPPRPSSVKPDIDPILERICLKAMAKDPAERFQSAEELAEDLERYLTQQPLRHACRDKRARCWLMGTAAVLALLLLTTIVYVKTGTGTLELEVPADARVTVDGERVEVLSGRQRLTLTVGRHEVTVAQGDQVARSTVTIRWRGETVQRRFLGQPSGPLPPAGGIEDGAEATPWKPIQAAGWRYWGCDRTATGTGLVAEMKVEQIRGVDAGVKKGPAFA